VNDDGHAAPRGREAALQRQLASLDLATPGRPARLGGEAAGPPQHAPDDDRRAGTRTGGPAYPAHPPPAGWGGLRPDRPARLQDWPRTARRLASRAMSVRECRSSFARMCDTCVCTVRRDRNRWAAICGFDMPSATSETTFSSVAVRLSHPCC